MIFNGNNCYKNAPQYYVYTFILSLVLNINNIPVSNVGDSFKIIPEEL